MPEHHLDAELLQRILGVVRQVLGESGQDARAGLDQHDARLTRVDAAEVGGQRGARQLSNRASELDPRRAGADDGESHQRRALPLVLFALRLLEGEQICGRVWWSRPRAS